MPTSPGPVRPSRATCARAAPASASSSPYLTVTSPEAKATSWRFLRAIASNRPNTVEGWATARVVALAFMTRYS